jgi:hypothetical protein
VTPHLLCTQDSNSSLERASVKTVGRLETQLWAKASSAGICEKEFDLPVPVTMAATASDSLSDSSDEEEEVDVGALKRLEEQLAANPADYNSHVEVWTQALLMTQLHRGACPSAGLNRNFDIMHDLP